MTSRNHPRTPRGTDVPDAEDETSLAFPAVRVRRALFGNRWTLLLDIVLPFAAYQILVSRGVAEAPALSATAAFPLAGTLGDWLRHRRLDAVGIVTLVFIAAGLLATFVTGNPRVMLMKGSVITGAFGLAFLGSLLLPRPLAFYLGRQVMTGDDPQLVARWNKLWQYPEFRHGNRVVSVAWGVGMMAEAALRVVAALSLSISVFLFVWPPISFAIYAVLMLWSIRYARR